jgi:Fe2+ transport system protein FeoA
MDKIGTKPGKKIRLIAREPFDGSLEIEVDKRRLSISKDVALNILVTI